jgi:hypothetical protein
MKTSVAEDETPKKRAADGTWRLLRGLAKLGAGEARG